MTIYRTASGRGGTFVVIAQCRNLHDVVTGLQTQTCASGRNVHAEDLEAERISREIDR